MRLIATTFVWLWTIFCSIAIAQPPAAQKWEPQIAAFEKQDAENFPEPNGVLFVGSSSIRMWDVKRFFSDVPVLNRGFGGSEYADAAHFVDRIVIPYRPATLVLYSGDNDLSRKKTPQQVMADLQRLVERVRTELPSTRIVIIAIKPSIARWNLIESIRETNRLVRDWSEPDPNTFFVEVESPMLGEDGRPRKELFQKDGLHLTDEGYEIWTALVRPYLAWGESPVATETVRYREFRRRRILRRCR